LQNMIKDFIKCAKASIAFCCVEIDMDKFADCTKRGEQCSTKLYNQEYVQGTRVCRIN